MQDSIAKEKGGVKNGWELVPLKGGEGGIQFLMANAIQFFHIFWEPFP